MKKLNFSKEQIIAERKNKLICREGDLLYKVFEPPFTKSDVLNEALNLARVEETGLNVPKIREVLTDGDKWAIVSDYIEGKTLQQLMEEDPEKTDEYLSAFVDLQMEIHAKQAPLLNKLKDKMNRKISASSLDATTRYELHTRLESMPKHTKVCHGDFNPSNVILSDKDGKYYVIDWAHATQGNASADVARTYLLFALSGKEDMADKYLSLFCLKSDTAKQYVQKWMPIVAASQSVKGRPEEKGLLLKWASVVDYE